jgi:hypothetical protein
MDYLIKRIDLMIEKYEMYINNMRSVKTISENLTARTEHVHRIEDHQGMIQDLKRIKEQVQYATVTT